MDAPPQSNQLLAGIRVIELGNFIAAPFAGRMFGDFGAEVIKIENPAGGDELREWRRIRGDTSMLFHTIARNKRSVTLDLRTPEGQNATLRLVAKSDVVIENFRPGTLERWGLAPEALAQVNPDIIVVRISGYGQTGPNRDRAGFGSAAESFAGLRYLTGEPDRRAGRAAASIGDAAAGLYGCIGALLLLLNRARGNSSMSRVVDVALYESVFSLLDSLVPDYDAYGMVRQRSGGGIPGIVPTGSYACRHGEEVVIGGNAHAVFARLMRAVGRDDLASDATLFNSRVRGEREIELNGAIEAWTSTRELSEVLRLLDKAGVPAAPVYDAKSIAEDSHYLARNMIQAHSVTVAGVPELVRFPGVVPKIPGNDGSIDSLGPALGADTVGVLRDIAGFRGAELDRICAANAPRATAR